VFARQMMQFVAMGLFDSYDTPVGLPVPVPIVFPITF